MITWHCCPVTPSNSGYYTKQKLWGFHPLKKCFQSKAPLNKSHRVPVLIPHGQHPRAVSCTRMATQTNSLATVEKSPVFSKLCQQRCPLQNTAGRQAVFCFYVTIQWRMQLVCVFSDLSVLGGLHRFCPATEGNALRIAVSPWWPNHTAWFEVRWRLRLTHVVLRQIKTKANEAVGRPCQLPQCVQVWKELQSSRKEDRIYFVTSTSVWCERASMSH